MSEIVVSSRGIHCGQQTLPPGLARGSGLLHERKSIGAVAWYQHDHWHRSWSYDSAAFCLLAGPVPCRSLRGWRPLLPGLARESGPSLSMWEYPCGSCLERKMQRT